MKKNFYAKKDKVYLSNKINNKEYFNIIINYFKRYKGNLSLLDAGCASGDFLHLLSKKKNFDLTGIDFSKPLLNLARKKVPSATFRLINLKKKINLNDKYDICTCLGTLSVFDNKFRILNKLVNLVKKKGELIIFDPINEYDVNVLVRYQKNFENKNEWLSGFNTHSKKYWAQKLNLNSKIKSFSFKKFDIKKKIKQNKNNPMRSWTEKRKNKNQIMVGTGQLLNFYFVKIKIK
jgi:2-polyprenyl-3-methyl-5-hydroxy-6-metoxy-1,4-benzoquinol methylase